MRYGETVLVWLVLLVCAVLNGAIRELYMTPRMGEQPSQFISCGILSALILIVAALYVRYIGGMSSRMGLQIGTFWLVLTVSFEFLFGHYLLGHSWTELRADYNIVQGRCWPLVLIVTLLAPLGTARVFSHRQGVGGEKKPG